jgi:hypothetical protein
MWPNEGTVWLLFAGLMPLVYATALVTRYGVKELSSLRFLGVLFIWIGYHFSPWQSYLTGEMWDTYLLVPSQIDDALLFTTFAMFAFLIGYARVFQRKHARLRGRMSGQFALPRVKPDWVVWLGATVLVLTIITVGGIEEFWASQFTRGYGQFEERDFLGAIGQMLGVIRLPLEVMLGMMASLLILRAKGSGPAYLLGFTALLVASLSSMWGFSRAAGFPFLFLAFLAFRMKARRSAGVALACMVLAFYLGSVGSHERHNNPGIANFTKAAFGVGEKSALTSGVEESIPFINPLDAMPAFTRKAEQRLLEPSPLFTVVGKFFLESESAAFGNRAPLPARQGSCRCNGHSWLRRIDNASVRRSVLCVWLGGSRHCRAAGRRACLVRASDCNSSGRCQFHSGNSRIHVSRGGPA